MHLSAPCARKLRIFNTRVLLPLLLLSTVLATFLLMHICLQGELSCFSSDVRGKVVWNKAIDTKHALLALKAYGGRYNEDGQGKYDITRDKESLWKVPETVLSDSTEKAQADKLRPPSAKSQVSQIVASKPSQSAKTSAEVLKDYAERGPRLRQMFSCKKLFNGDSNEQGKVAKFQAVNNNTYESFDSELVPTLLQDCEAFKARRGYMQHNITNEEENFPLAYVILVHIDFEHLERLLRTLYRPHNSFCIHLDDKASESLKRAVSALAACFPNVILASRPQRVVYAHMSRLMADIVCMRDLLRHDSSWRYLINMAATEFPLRSNLQTVQILQTLHGLNDIREVYAMRVVDRFSWEHKIVGDRMVKTQTALPPPPHNITVVKGLAYNSYSREFLKWAMTDQRSLDLLAWSNLTYSPDEHYWGTLNNLYHNPFLKSPGGFKGHPDRMGYISKYINWQYNNSRHPCHGRIVRKVCVFSTFDLMPVIHVTALAANKFDLTFDPVAYACMEELLELRTRSTQPFDLSKYKRLYYVRFREDSNTSNGTKHAVGKS